jgi:hypothetical protein
MCYNGDMDETQAFQQFMDVLNKIGLMLAFQVLMTGAVGIGIMIHLRK